MSVYVFLEQFQESFRKHYAAYTEAIARKDKKNASYCLLLFYAVECGLKALILRQNNSDFSKELVENTVDGRLKEFFTKGHDLNSMIDYLNLGGEFFLPNPLHPHLKVSDVHLAWRYRSGFQGEEAIEQKLVEISNEIGGRL